MKWHRFQTSLARNAHIRKRAPRLGSKGRPNPIDVHVGARIKLRRMVLGLSQTQLGEALGLSFQQVQKYERGTNRVSSSRLFDLCRILDVPVAYFFEDMDAGVQGQSPARLQDVAPRISSAKPDPMLRRATLDLVRAYYSIPDRLRRKRLLRLVKAIAKSPE